MGALRRLGQNLGLGFRDEDAWRPVGWTPPTASTSQPNDTPPVPPPAKPGAAGRPWWYVTWPASQDGLILIGMGYAFFGLLGLVLYALGGGPIWLLLFSPVYLVLGSIYRASAVARYRRERSGRASGAAVPLVFLRPPDRAGILPISAAVSGISPGSWGGRASAR